MIISIAACCREDKPFVYDRVLVIYMAANNNLENFAKENITSIKMGYLPSYDSKEAIFIFRHLPGESPALYRLLKDGRGNVKEVVVKNYEGYSSSSPSTLNDVLSLVGNRFKSDSYGLILWSHSTGWLPTGYFDSVNQPQLPFTDPYAGIVKSFGNDNGVEMELTDLAAAIPFKFSYIIFDSCFNGGIETVYELKDKAHFIVASPTEILATGFPYDRVIEPLLKEMDLNEVCQQFYDYYTVESGYNAATISIFDTSGLDELAEECSRLFSLYRNKIPMIDLASIQQYFRMDKHWFYDLRDMIHSITPAEDWSQFQSLLDKVVVAKWYTDFFLSIPISRYSGISTYLPKPSNTYLDNYYKRYKWNIDTGMIQ